MTGVGERGATGGASCQTPEESIASVRTVSAHVLYLDDFNIATAESIKQRR